MSKKRGLNLFRFFQKKNPSESQGSETEGNESVKESVEERKVYTPRAFSRNFPKYSFFAGYYSSHGFFQDTSWNVHGFGHNEHGQLGLGYTNSEKKMNHDFNISHLVKYFKSIRIRNIVTGIDASVFTTSKGTAYFAGRSVDNFPTPIKILKKKNSSIFEIVGGKDAYFLIVQKVPFDEIYTFGNNNTGCLGTGNQKNVTVKCATLVKLPEGVKLLSLISGGFVTYFLDVNYKVLVAGRYSRRNPQVCVPMYLPKHVQYDNLNGVTSGYEHVFFLVGDRRRKVPHIDGFYGYGTNWDGRLGMVWNRVDEFAPEKITLRTRGSEKISLEEAGERLVDISAGGFHSLFVFASGKVFSTGWNSDGQVGGMDGESHNNIPFLIPLETKCGNRSPKCVKGYASCVSSYFAMNCGCVLGCGRNQHGEVFTAAKSRKVHKPIVMIDCRKVKLKKHDRLGLFKHKKERLELLLDRKPLISENGFFTGSVVYFYLS